MIQWKEICCAVDFAEPSRAALDAAAELAGRLAAELTLVHVVPPPPAPASDVLGAPLGMAGAPAEGDEQVLAGWRAEAERRTGRAVRSRLLSGDPAAEILRLVRENRCDLLVVGTHGRKGVSRLVLGSVAERVARESPCPVLVVHDHRLLEREEEAEESAQYR